MPATQLTPLILTARLDPQSQIYFNALRQRHFPSERNYLDAHLTLFHALPSVALERIHAHISDIASRQPVLEARATGLRSLGRGIAFIIECPPLAATRAALAQAFESLLTRQDRQRWKPHITVQNKVSAGLAQAAFEELRHGFHPRAIQLAGLDLWYYVGGPWDPARSYSFDGA